MLKKKFLITSIGRLQESPLHLAVQAVQRLQVLEVQKVLLNGI
jgi:hypothetical protein